MTTFIRIFPREELLALLVASNSLSAEDILGHSELFLTVDTTAFFFFHALFLQWPNQFFHVLDLFYHLAVPPFLGREKTAVVQDCQRLFSDIWLQQVWQNHLQFYHANEKMALYTQTHMATIMKQLNYPGMAHMQLQRANLLAQEKQQNISLASRIVPFPWESLTSVVARASHLFGLNSPEHLLQAAFSFYHLEKRNLLLLTDTKDYAFLQHMLHLEREMLYHLTVHQFANPLQRSERLVPVAEKYLSLEVNALHWIFPDVSYTRVCPRCLAEEAYDRLYWIARPVLVCPYHYLRLVQVRPSCKQKIPTLRTSLFHCLLAHLETIVPHLQFRSLKIICLLSPLPSSCNPSAFLSHYPGISQIIWPHHP